ERAGLRHAPVERRTHARPAHAHVLAETRGHTRCPRSPRHAARPCERRANAREV
ncbi:MAG: hypothetical protein AVDCRST_MAG64-749, partial [uncultured Phycisphaerae bacterium]